MCERAQITLPSAPQYDVIPYHKGSAWVRVGTHAPDRKNYEVSISGYFKVHMKTPFAATNRIMPMPSGAERTQRDNFTVSSGIRRYW